MPIEKIQPKTQWVYFQIALIPSIATAIQPRTHLVYFQIALISSVATAMRKPRGNQYDIYDQFDAREPQGNVMFTSGSGQKITKMSPSVDYQLLLVRDKDGSGTYFYFFGKKMRLWTWRGARLAKIQ